MIDTVILENITKAALLQFPIYITEVDNLIVYLVNTHHLPDTPETRSQIKMMHNRLVRNFHTNQEHAARVRV